MKSLVTKMWRVAAIAALSWAPVSHAELIHRYSFTTDATDSVQGSNGVSRQTVTGGVPNGQPVLFSGGTAILDGVGSYIDLPNGLISGQTNITIETWFSWGGSGGNWQRVFDIGVGSGGEDTDGTKAAGNGTQYMFFAPAAGDANQLPRFTINDGSGERPILGSSTYLNFGGENHVVIVYTTNVARVFINGEQVAIGESSIPLSAINDVNVWLGRSNYGADAMFSGSFNEFRVFNHALTAQQIKASYFSFNPDAISQDPGTLSSVSLTAQTSMLAGEVQSPSIIGQFSLVGPVTLNAADLVLTSSVPSVVSITKSGNFKAEGAGTATITAALGGQSASVTITVSASAPYLVNRYSFNEAAGATTVTDSVGGRTGTVIAGTNSLIFDGTNVTFTTVDNFARATYIDLGAGLLTGRTNITIQSWFTWAGPTGENWQRLYDFGDSGKGANAQANGNGLGYVFLSPRKGDGLMGTEFRTPAPHASVVLSNPGGTAPANQQVHVVAVFAPKSQTTKLYVNGVLVASGGVPLFNGVPVQFSDLPDLNNWIGASQWQDPSFKGKLNELRVHEGVLSDLDIALSLKAGPDTLPVAPGSLQSVSLTALPASFIGNLAASQAQFIGNFQNVSGVLISGISGVTFASTDTNVFAVTAIGGVTPRNVGAANLIASYQGQSATTSVQVLAPLAIRQLSLTTNLHGGSRRFTSVLQADYTGTNNVAATAFAGVTRTSSDTNVVTISNAGLVTPRLPGTATLTAVYNWVTAGVTNGLTNSVSVTVVNPPTFTKGTLVHRYSFSEAAGVTTVADSIGTANGIVANATGTDFTGSGELALPGGGAGSPYVDLPNGLVSGLTSISVEGWVTWQGAADSSWQRIFDFGRSTAVDGGGIPLEDMPGTGFGYMFLTPRNGGNLTQFAIKEGTGAETPVITTAPFPVGTKTHFAVVYDTVHAVARLYINGVRVNTGNVTLPLSVIQDINVWLGRAQFNDPYFNGSYDEFRIYDGPLLDADVTASFAAGPNTLAVSAPSVAIGKVGSNIEITWPESASGYVLQSSTQVGGSYGPAAVTPTTNAGVVKATIPVATGATNVFFQLKK